MRLCHVRRVHERHQGAPSRVGRTGVHRSAVQSPRHRPRHCCRFGGETAAIHSIDARCQTRIAVAARKLGVIRSDVAIALSLSPTHKAVGFDRRMPEVDFDALDQGASSLRACERPECNSVFQPVSEPWLLVTRHRRPASAAESDARGDCGWRPRPDHAVARVCWRVSAERTSRS